MSKVTKADPNASCTFRFSRDLVFISPDFTMHRYFRVPLVDQATDAVSEPRPRCFPGYAVKYVIHGIGHWVKKFSCWYASGHHLMVPWPIAIEESRCTFQL